MLRELRHCLEIYERLLPQVNIQDRGEARIAVCFILTAAEQFGAALLLSERGFSSHAPSHLRSMLEAHIFVEILAQDPSYSDQLRFESARKDQTFLSEFLASPEIQEDAKVLQQVREMLDNAARTLAELAPQERRAMTTIETFRLAGKAELYLAFRQFSSFVHPNLRAATARHRGDDEIAYRRALPDDAILSHIAIGLTVLARMMERLPSFTDLTPNDLQPARAAVQQLLRARAG